MDQQYNQALNLGNSQPYDYEDLHSYNSILVLENYLNEVHIYLLISKEDFQDQLQHIMVVFQNYFQKYSIYKHRGD
jgi:hypothetical protein